MDLLDFDRYWYVFEVLYPENRFPTGLCITDYGNREELVLTCMRERRTNRMVPFAESIREAERVGLPAPRVFRGTLDDALTLTSQLEDHLRGRGLRVAVLRRQIREDQVASLFEGAQVRQ